MVASSRKATLADYVKCSYSCTPLVLVTIISVLALFYYGFSYGFSRGAERLFLLFLIYVVIAGLVVSVVSFKNSIEYRPAFERLNNLFREVKKHNQIVKDIHVLDQLREAGNPVGLSDREQVLEALRLTRGHLVRAFRTERILRENPDFKREQFRIDLTAYHALQISEEASDYGRLLDAALQVGVEVQEEMVKLLQDPTSE